MTTKNTALLTLSLLLFLFSKTCFSQGVTNPICPTEQNRPQVCNDINSNVIVKENCECGSPEAEWALPYGRVFDPLRSVLGFSTDISYNIGSKVEFKISVEEEMTASSLVGVSPDHDYTLDIYRVGYYYGFGARLIKAGIVPQKPSQPRACSLDGNTNKSELPPTSIDSPYLLDCGNWEVNAEWDTSAEQGGLTPGLYFAAIKSSKPSYIENPANPSNSATGVTVVSHIYFILRDDNAAPSDIILQTSDATWNVYNTFTDRPKSQVENQPIETYELSLYVNELITDDPRGRAGKVSYNRPLVNYRMYTAEISAIRWLEKNGFDVSYWSSLDTDRFGNRLSQSSTKPKAFISVGHDEYWSGNQRQNVEAARDNGVSLAFWSGNEVYWKTYWEDDRTIMCRKETHGNPLTLESREGYDPNAPQEPWTGTWRDFRVSGHDGGDPENGLTGTIFTSSLLRDAEGSMFKTDIYAQIGDTGFQEEVGIQVPARFAGMRLWRGTEIASGLTSVVGEEAEVLGFEFDEDIENSVRPDGLIRLSETKMTVGQYLIDMGSIFRIGDARHSLTMYRHGSGALVFGAGTFNWGRGLERGYSASPFVPDENIQKAMINLFADMGIQPQSSDYIAAKSTDTTPPTTTINPITIDSWGEYNLTGTTSDDAGGKVASVEVSIVANGETGAWRVAELTNSNWSHRIFTPKANSFVVRVRAIDDSGNIQASPTETTYSVSKPYIKNLLFTLGEIEFKSPTFNDGIRWDEFVGDGSQIHDANLGTSFTSEKFDNISPFIGGASTREQDILFSDLEPGREYAFYVYPAYVNLGSLPNPIFQAVLSPGTNDEQIVSNMSYATSGIKASYQDSWEIKFTPNQSQATIRLRIGSATPSDQDYPYMYFDSISANIGILDGYAQTNKEAFSSSIGDPTPVHIVGAGPSNAVTNSYDNMRQFIGVSEFVHEPQSQRIRLENLEPGRDYHLFIYPEFLSDALPECCTDTDPELCLPGDSDVFPNSPEYCRIGVPSQKLIAEYYPVIVEGEAIVGDPITQKFESGADLDPWKILFTPRTSFITVELRNSAYRGLRSGTHYMYFDAIGIHPR